MPPNVLANIKMVKWLPQQVVEESCAKTVGYLEQIDTFIFFSELC